MGSPLDFLFSGEPSPTVDTSSVSSTSQPLFWQQYVNALMGKASAIAGTPYQAYTGPLVAPQNAAEQQAASLTQSGIGNWQPNMTAANTSAGNAATSANNIASAGAPAIQSGIGASGYNAGSGLVNNAAGVDPLATANPYLTVGSTMTPDVINSYMSPYMSDVTDQIATLGNRNLTENLLPNISDQFVKAGQFGGSREGTFANRALRDTQEAISNAQGTALQQGYGAAQTAANNDLTRIAGIGSTAGNLAATGAGIDLNAGNALASMTNEDAARSLTGGVDLSNITAQQAAAQNTNAGTEATLGAATQTANLKDAAGINAIGQQQQQQTQAEDTAAQGQFTQEQQYPYQQAQFLNQIIRGINPPTSTATTTSAPATASQMTSSPLTQLASAGLGAYGLSQILKRGGRVKGIGTPRYAEGGGAHSVAAPPHKPNMPASYRPEAQGAAEYLTSSDADPIERGNYEALIRKGFDPYEATWHATNPVGRLYEATGWSDPWSDNGKAAGGPVRPYARGGVRRGIGSAPVSRLARGGQSRKWATNMPAGLLYRRGINMVA